MPTIDYARFNTLNGYVCDIHWDIQKARFVFTIGTVDERNSTKDLIVFKQLLSHGILDENITTLDEAIRAARDRHDVQEALV